MTDTREATPRPWEVCGGHVRTLHRPGMPNDAGGVEIARCTSYFNNEAANAALIVQAVNRDELWPEAVRIVKALYAAVLVDDDEGLAEHAEPMEAARALISKLEASHGSA